MLNWDTNTAVRSVVGGNGHSDTDLAAEQRVEPQVKTRNTLFIGLGGTGQRTGLYLKATFLNQYGYIPDWLRIVVFDTANEPLVVRLKNGKDVSLEPGTEFVNMGQVPVGRIIRHRERQRAITERFGESLLRLPPTVLRHGAKQERLLGLLALYWHYHSVEDNLRRAIWHLAGRDNRRRDVIDVEQGLNVFIVNSLCGGTGAGTFLDVAFLVRALVDELGDLSDFCQITGVGVLPGAFPDVTGPYMLPNTVASLMELNHVMTHNDFEAGYPNGFKATIWTNENPIRVKYAEIFQEQLRQVGIEVSIEILEWSAYLTRTAAGEHDMFILGWVAVTGDADYGMYALFHSSQFGEAGNRTFYKNADLDRFLDEGRTSPDPEKRRQAYFAAQEIVMNQAPWVFMYVQDVLSLSRSWVSNYKNHAAGHHILYEVYNN